MSTYNLMFFNKEPTRHLSQTKSGLEEHFISNMHNNIDNVTTKHIFFTDHDMVCLMLYSLRYLKSLSRDSLLNEMKDNENLNSIFNFLNSNKILTVFV